MMVRVFRLKEEMTPKKIERYLDKKLNQLLYRNVQLLEGKFIFEDGTLIAILLPVPEKIGLVGMVDRDEKKAVLEALSEIAEDTEELYEM